MRILLFLIAIACLAFAGTAQAVRQTPPPFATLDLPARNISLPIFSQFSPNKESAVAVWRAGSAMPGFAGISMISVRHTKEDSVRHLKPGDHFLLTLPNGKKFEYEVKTFMVSPQTEVRITPENDKNTLLLTSCYKAANWRQEKDICFIALARSLKQMRKITS